VQNDYLGFIVKTYSNISGLAENRKQLNILQFWSLFTDSLLQINAHKPKHSETWNTV